MEEIINVIDKTGEKDIDIISFLTSHKDKALKINGKIFLLSKTALIDSIKCNNYIKKGICNSTSKPCIFTNVSFMFSTLLQDEITTYSKLITINVMAPCVKKRIFNGFDIIVKYNKPTILQ